MHQKPLELIYYGTGVISVVLALLIGYVFTSKNANFIRSRIFLKYSLFRLSFFIFIAGLIIFAIANVLAIIDLEMFHELGEIIYNISIIVFVTIMYIILNPFRKIITRDNKNARHKKRKIA
jgi:hypothetical protein